MQHYFDQLNCNNYRNDHNCINLCIILEDTYLHASNVPYSLSIFIVPYFIICFVIWISESVQCMHILSILLINFQFSNICQIMLKFIPIKFPDRSVLQYSITMEVSSNCPLHMLEQASRIWQHHYSHWKVSKHVNNLHLHTLCLSRLLACITLGVRRWIVTIL